MNMFSLSVCLLFASMFAIIFLQEVQKKKGPGVFDCRTLWFAVHCKSFSNLGDIDQSANGLQGDLHQISAA